MCISSILLQILILSSIICSLSNTFKQSERPENSYFVKFPLKYRAQILGSWSTCQGGKQKKGIFEIHSPEKNACYFPSLIISTLIRPKQNLTLL